MSDIALEAYSAAGRHPESEQSFAYEFIKKLVRAWDPDFTKVTPEEAKRLQAAEESGFIDESEVDWTNLGRAYQ